MTVEERLTLLEREFAKFKENKIFANQDWIARISGSFKDDPDFGEILRLGSEIRDSEKPVDGGGEI